MSSWFEAQANNQYIVLDPELGWTVRPHGVGATYRSDARGVRRASGRHSADVPPDGVVRIVSVGDSFTHGDEVADGET